MWLELTISAGSRNQRKKICHWVTGLRSVQWEMGVHLPSASDVILPRLVLLAGAHYPPCYNSDPWAGNRRKRHNDWSWPYGSDLWDDTASYLNWAKMENYCYLYSEGESNTPGGGRGWVRDIIPQEESSLWPETKWNHKASTDSRAL